MSKLTTENFKNAIQNVLDGAGASKRKFVETIEVQICLKDFDPSRDKRIGGAVKLPLAPRERFNFCILADAHHAEEAKNLGVDFLDLESLKKMNRNKKLIRKLCQKYDAFIVSQVLIPQIPRLLPGLNKVGKFPTPCTHSESLTDKMDEIKKTVRTVSKKDINVGFAVANVNMSADEVRQNALLVINYVVSQLKKNWSNVKSLTIKSTMGKPQRIFG